MKEEQVRSALEMWFEDTDPQPPDPRQTAARVMTRVLQTRQRRRRLPFALFREKAQAPTPTSTIEYQPQAIPATNGHTPTVIGRTQSMLSPAKAIAAGALIFAIGGAFLIAQPFDRQGSVPGATTDDPGPAAYVHGLMVQRDCCGDEAETFDDDGDRLTLRGMVASGTMEMDDPRITGSYELTVSVDEFPQPDTDARVEVHWGELTITNDAGGWNGTWSSTYDSAQAAETDLGLYELTGTGAYEGLSALLSETGSQLTWPSSPLAGAIFPSPLPPR